MRKLALMMGISLDGLVARPSPYGAGGWGVPPEDAALKARKLAWLAEAGTHLMGRVTYQEMSGFWPTSDDEYAAPMNELPKVVFSKTLTEAEATWPGSTIASGELAVEVAALKQAPGKDLIAWGGAAFAHSLVRADLIDEYRLVHQPVALGDGHPLFAGLPEPLVLDLVDARAYGDGSVLHVYRPVTRRTSWRPSTAVASRPPYRLYPGTDPSTWTRWAPRRC
jgi:dihydrofolate reductase